MFVEGRQEGWQGEEPYLESDKSNVQVRAAVKQINNHMCT